MPIPSASLDRKLQYDSETAVNCRIARQIDRQLAKLSPAPLLGLAPGMNFESAHSANCGCSRPRPKKTAERKKTPDENPPHENLRRKSPMTFRRKKRAKLISFIHKFRISHLPRVESKGTPCRTSSAAQRVKGRCSRPSGQLLSELPSCWGAILVCLTTSTRIQAKRSCSTLRRIAVLNALVPMRPQQVHRLHLTCLCMHKATSQCNLQVLLLFSYCYSAQCSY